MEELKDPYNGKAAIVGGAFLHKIVDIAISDKEKRYWTAVMIAQGRFSLREPDITIKERIEYCYRVADELLRQEGL